LERAETRAVAMVMPAEGPSLGIAPSGMWMWISVCAKISSSIPSSRRPGSGVGVGRLGRLAHDIAELAGQLEDALSLHRDHFDEENVAAGGGDRESGRHPNLVLTEHRVGFDLGRLRETL
jgi:hypothetical protein